MHKQRTYVPPFTNQFSIITSFPVLRKYHQSFLSYTHKKTLCNIFSNVLFYCFVVGLNMLFFTLICIQMLLLKYRDLFLCNFSYNLFMSEGLKNYIFSTLYSIFMFHFTVKLRNDSQQCFCILTLNLFTSSLLAHKQHGYFIARSFVLRINLPNSVGFSGKHILFICFFSVSASLISIRVNSLGYSVIVVSFDVKHKLLPFCDFVFRFQS